MRELQVCPKRRAAVVQRLRFIADGAELAAWVGGELFACAMDSGNVRALHEDELLRNWRGGPDPRPELQLSPGADCVAFAANLDADNTVYFAGVAGADDEQPWGTIATTGTTAHVGLMFTANGKEIIAVRNFWDPDADDEVPAEPDVARFKLGALNAIKNDWEGIMPGFDETAWNRALQFPQAEHTSAEALGANDRLVAVGTAEGTVRVADLRKKKVIASFPWAGGKVRNRSVTRVGFDPKSETVASLAGGSLFAQPLGKGTAWQTDGALGRVNDFAYHPDGSVLCAVFADGRARFLDARAGAVRETFAWRGKGPLYSVCFAPDGLTCAAGAAKGKAIVWDVDL